VPLNRSSGVLVTLTLSSRLGPRAHELFPSSICHSICIVPTFFLTSLLKKILIYGQITKNIFSHNEPPLIPRVDCYSICIVLVDVSLLFMNHLGQLASK